jgi:hypothetical protein
MHLTVKLSNHYYFSIFYFELTDAQVHNYFYLLTMFHQVLIFILQLNGLLFK